jgi:L-aspartate oxidase
VVFAERAARRLKGATLNPPGEASAIAPPEMNELSMVELRKRMHSQVGVVREARGLAATLDWMEAAFANVGPARALVAARLIAAGALARLESRGGHYRSDYPQTLAPHRTFIRRGPDGAPLIQHSAIAEGV